MKIESEYRQKYTDSIGEKCTIFEMVRREPEWVASKFLTMEKESKELRVLKLAAQNVCDAIAEHAKPCDIDGGDFDDASPGCVACNLYRLCYNADVIKELIEEKE